MERENFEDLQRPEEDSAGLGGLGDRSASASEQPGRTGVGGGYNADDLRTPMSGNPNDSLDETNEDTGDDAGDPLGLENGDNYTDPTGAPRTGNP
jgi:hypothetical protein